MHNAFRKLTQGLLITKMASYKARLPQMTGLPCDVMLYSYSRFEFLLQSCGNDVYIVSIVDCENFFSCEGDTPFN